MSQAKSKRRTMHDAYASQRNSSRLRGIPFLISFEEWVMAWDDSGHWEDRGRKKGQYCMARFGDIGPYAVGNVKIITNIENNAERKCSEFQREVARRPHSKEHNKKVSDALKGRVFATEHRQKISAALKGKPKSFAHVQNLIVARSRRPPPSDETRRRMSESGRIRAARERVVRLRKVNNDV